MPSAYKTAEAGSTGLVRDGDLRTGEVAVIDGALICPREVVPPDFTFGAPKEEEDDNDCSYDDYDYSGYCNSGSKAHHSELSATTPATGGFHGTTTHHPDDHPDDRPVSSTPVGSSPGTTTTHHGTLSFEWANKSCCNTEAAATRDIDGTQSTDGTQSSPTTLPAAANGDIDGNIVHEWLRALPEVKRYEEKAKRWGKSGRRLALWSVFAGVTRFEDVFFILGMNFGPEGEDFIANKDLLLLDPVDGLPMAKCQKHNFKTGIKVLMTHFGKTEEEAKDFLLNHTLVVNRLLCDGPSDWRSNKDTRDDYNEFCEYSDKIVSVLMKRLMKKCTEVRAILLFGGAAYESFYEQNWLSEYNHLLVQNGTKLPHALPQMLGWQSKHDLINVMRCWIDALHRVIYNESTHDLEVLPNVSEYGLPFVGRTMSMCPCNSCHGESAGSYVDRNRVRQGDNLFVVCSGYTMLHKDGDYMKHDVSCGNCYLEEKCDGKKICDGCFKNKRCCKTDGCTKRIVNNGVCVEHGATVKCCKTDGCTKRIQNNGVCVEHGAEKKVSKTCSTEGCTKYAQNNGVCVEHGAEKKVSKTCSTEGCTKYAQNNGVCRLHGATVKCCKTDGCTKRIVNNGVCKRHGATVKCCSTEGCTKYAQNNGVCVEHGAEKKVRKTCSTEGCTKYAQKGGVCRKHENEAKRKTHGDDERANKKRKS